MTTQLSNNDPDRRLAKQLGKALVEKVDWESIDDPLVQELATYRQKRIQTITNERANSGDIWSRLGHYQRMDLTLEYKNKFNFGKMNTAITLFNIFNRPNPRYRDLTFVVDQQSSVNRFRTVPVDVYDLGFQPSFNISFSF